MPEWVADEDKWKKASQLAKQQGKPRDYDYITGIYKQMGGRIKKGSGEVGAKKEDVFDEGFLGDIKNWVGNFIKNPIKASIAALLIYNILKKEEGIPK